MEFLTGEDIAKIGKPICLDDKGNPVYIGDFYTDYNVYPKTPPRQEKISYTCGEFDGVDYLVIGFVVPNSYRLDSLDKTTI